LLVIILAAAASTASAKSADLSALLAAIRQVESAGNDRAVGDGGKSRGPFQIQRAYWREAVAGTDAAGWNYDRDVWDGDRAGYVVWLHWGKTCPAALRGGDVEQLARRHRLPNAPWQADNAVYWRKVHVILTLKETGMVANRNTPAGAGISARGVKCPRCGRWLYDPCEIGTPRLRTAGREQLLARCQHCGQAIRWRQDNAVPGCRLWRASKAAE
jgi:hypothetical protein